MFGLFGKSRFLDADVEDWVLETWVWLMSNLGGMSRISASPLVTANKDFFPVTDTVGEERGAYVFGRVKSLMHMDNWPCTLEVIHRQPDGVRVGTYAKLQRSGGALGTFRVEERQAIVSYASDLVDNPRQLIAVFAHELSHYLLATVRKPIPGGQELHELATELTVAYVGFGLFGANSAFSFEQHQDTFGQGWSAGRSGYFSERTWAFAIALFAALKGIEVPLGELKGSVADLTRKAGRYLERNGALTAPLAAIP